MQKPDPAATLVEDLFRTESGRMTARLCRLLGPGSMGEAEEIVQDSLTKALALWPFQGTPTDPAAWLWRVARNAATDRMRRRRFSGDMPPDEALPVTTQTDPHFVSEIVDERLGLMFACAHPALPAEQAAALMLRHVCGLGPAEIARAFLVPLPTLSQRLTRGRTHLAELEVGVTIPPPPELPRRLEAMRLAIYLMLTSAFDPSLEDQAAARDLASEAARLSAILAGQPGLADPAGHAFAALCALAAARVPARFDPEGGFLPLSGRDPGAWDKRAVETGFRHLAASLAGETETRWHLEAAIAACHAAGQPVDWARIVELYDRLLILVPGPVTAFNRALALAERDGRQVLSGLLAPLRDEPALASQPGFHAALAEGAAALGDHAAARTHLDTALAMPLAPAMRRHLQGRRAGFDTP